MKLQGKRWGIEYVSTWHSDGLRLCWTAQLARDGTSFLAIDGCANVRGCSEASFPAFVAWDVEASIDEEIAVAKSGQHLAGRFLVTGLA